MNIHELVYAIVSKTNISGEIEIDPPIAKDSFKTTILLWNHQKLLGGSIEVYLNETIDTKLISLDTLEQIHWRTYENVSSSMVESIIKEFVMRMQSKAETD